jgi:polysaccharide export outer membrane protein
MIRYILYFFLLLLLFGCSNKKEFILFNQADINKSKESKVEDSHFNNIQFEYKIVPHDRVSVIVYQHPEFSSSSLETRMRDKGLLVNSKGDIRLPLVKSIHIAGLTQTEALDKVENAFKKYLKSPDIYLEVLNKRAYVIGEVKTPGEIELVNEKISLIQILAKAGDLTDFANKKSIMILRSKQGQVNSQIVDLTDINSLRTSNLMIKPNDIVYVLPNDMKPFNRGIKDIDPIFGLIGHILSPFVSMKYLSN